MMYDVYKQCMYSYGADAYKRFTTSELNCIRLDVIYIQLHEIVLKLISSLTWSQPTAAEK